MKSIASFLSTSVTARNLKQWHFVVRAKGCYNLTSHTNAICEKDKYNYIDEYIYSTSDSN